MSKGVVALSTLVVTALACQPVPLGSQGAEPAAAHPRVLFQDDFSDQQLNNWSTGSESGAAREIADGTLRIKVDVPQNLVWSRPGKDFQDVRIEVDATKSAGPDVAEFGVMCRYSENEDGSYNFYYLVIAGDTYAAIIKVIGNEQIEISSRDDAFDAIKAGNTENHILAECVGDRLSLYANGRELFSESDASLSGGDVGLIAVTYEESGIEVWFDNFVVSAP